MAEAGPFTANVQSSQKNISKRIGSAEALKANGNDFYKQKDYKSAIGKYHRALLTVKDIDQRSRGHMLQSFTGIAETTQPLSGIASDRVHKIELSCYNNLAACLLHLPNPNYEKIHYYCKEVLRRDEENTKALYRQGVALYHQKEYNQATESLLTAKKSSTDPEIRKYLKLCKEANSRQLIQEKQRCQDIFNKMALEEDIEKNTRNGDRLMDQ